MMARDPEQRRRRASMIRLALGMLIAGAVAVWAFHAVDLAAVVDAFAIADVGPTVGRMTALVLLVWFVRAWRWHLILLALGTRVPFVATYMSTAVSLGLSAVTPVQAGEVIKVVHANRRFGAGAAASVGGFAFERVADLTVLLAMTFAVGHLLLVPQQAIALTALIVVGLGVVFGAIAVWILHRFAAESVTEFIRGARVLLDRPALHLGVWTATIACWVLTAVLWKTALGGVGIDTSLQGAALLVGLVTLVGIAVLVPAGVGVSEATVTALLVQQGFAPEEGLAGALALRFITLIAIALGAGHWVAMRIAEWSSD